ncbi:tyrosinase cofactor [Streptomyces sp. NBC_01142]|uniref:tyrosinase family oxidase copper chaperone n=1 Tax=Streptomyces sp. NBC_01142 TaxID=2975865 RepID=UPI00224E156B|nr:tyrosinase family oxidase copper chaperone [Streptomyces sp. NBC_01142]MCX4824973.1 tyrosinase cofactor [Streptomyces sp. NBC_01142]
MKRREALIGAAAVGAGAAIPAVAGYRGGGGQTAASAPVVAEAPAVHTERYQGRTIQVADHGGTPAVTIDGRELHLMRLADDAYLSAMCHYELSATPLQAARRAVQELRGAQLLPLGHSGVHQT